MKGPAPRCGLGEDPLILVLGLISLAMLLGGAALAIRSVTR